MKHPSTIRQNRGESPQGFRSAFLPLAGPDKALILDSLEPLDFD